MSRWAGMIRMAEMGKGREEGMVMLRGEGIAEEKGIRDIKAWFAVGVVWREGQKERYGALVV